MYGYLVRTATRITAVLRNEKHHVAPKSRLTGRKSTRGQSALLFVSSERERPRKVFMYIVYGHNFLQKMDQPGMAANPARGQLKRENYFFQFIFCLPPFGPENLVSRDRFGRPVPRQPAHSPHSG